ncbi:MAG TPA: PDZ domain-containing protein [Fimbriimonas sp.]|nr:PDZ domain-containing protein [Fimbriimonas sp.]
MPLLSSALALAAVGVPAQTFEVPFKIGETAIVVDAQVNGKPVSLMFDTGFSGSVVVDNTINLGKPTGKITLRDFVRESEAATVKVTSLMLGQKKIDPTGMVAVMTPPANYSFAFNTHCDGIMGFEVIKHDITEINFENKKFIFHPKTVDISKRTPDNKRTFKTKLLPIGNNSMEMSVDLPTGKSMTLALDTGNSFYATTHKDVLQRVGLWDLDKEPKFTSLSGVASGTVTSFNIRVPDVKIFGIPVQNSVWDIIDLPSSSAEGDGTIGFGFLKNFNIVIDYERRTVWFENFTGKVTDEAMGETGISATFSDTYKGIVVARVAPESPAAEAGIKERDVILSIDGRDLHRETYRQMRQLLEGPVGSKVKLAIQRGSSLKRFEVERKELIN